ncbi:MAG: hypothetical protein Q9191_004665 [Dirinaria sp. TL-2023a]
MRGRLVPHPATTNFDEGFETPTAKRLKSLDSTDSSYSRDVSVEDDSDVKPTSSDKDQIKEIRDSEAESDDDNQPPRVSQTELESALPPIKTDKEAIAEYEAARAAESAEDIGLQGRLGQRKWIRGKSSIYVDAFNLALETVLEDESHLFDEAELEVFQQWRNLSYEGQYLYVRLFLRKTAAWHRINRLGYYGDIGDMSAAVEELLKPRPLPEITAVRQENPGEVEPPKDMIFGQRFTFADGSQEHINTLEEASSLLMLDELKDIAKDAKLQGKTKRELLQSLRRTSSKQSGIGFASLKRSETDESIKLDRPIDENGNNIQDFETCNANRDTHYLRSILSSTGPCIRLSSPSLKLFERVHLVFYRSTEWTEKSLTTIILARISRRNFPSYIVSRSANIFPSRSALLEFEASIRTQFRIDNILEFNGTPKTKDLQVVKDIFEEVYPRWCVLLEEEQRKEDRVYESGEGAYLRRFSPAWVYTRIVHKGTAVLGRFKEHKREHEMLTELLEQHLFHAARRGAWYQRKALLEEHYMWALAPDKGGLSEEGRKKHWKRIALCTCEDGLQDRDCHLIYHYDLQKRITKLEKQLKVPKRQQHDFLHVRLTKPTERSIAGIRIERALTPAQRNGRRNSSPHPASSSGRRGAKTSWIDENENGGECSVEAMCLSHYRSEGWRGYHSEGGIVRTLFGYLFGDIMFTYVPNVFQTEYQSCPLDLFTDAFYPSRLSEINRRLVEIGNGAAADLIRAVWDREHERQTCIVGIDWTFALDDLLDIVACFETNREGLATICKVMAQEYQQRGGGIPDLFLWHRDAKEVMFAEVKSENDRLSDTQRLWIHVLTAAGIRVELANAVASKVRHV